MGKQYNSREKRKRRNRYIKRKKAERNATTRSKKGK
jgi:hypothetical protein